MIARQLTGMNKYLLLAALAFFSFADQNQASAQTATQIRQALQSRWWFQDLGTSGSSVFGQMYVFQSSVARTGWFQGRITTFRGMVGFGTTQPFIWRPIDGGFIIDFATRQVRYRFSSYNPNFEALSFSSTEQRQGVWVSTRSTLAPPAIRNRFYR